MKSDSSMVDPIWFKGKEEMCTDKMMSAMLINGQLPLSDFIIDDFM